LPDNLKVIEAINTYINNDHGNRLPDGQRIFEEALVGFAAASDPIFETFLQDDIIGPFYCCPESWLPGAMSVVVYFLPFSEHVRRSNYGGPPPSVEWLHARFLGESFNEKLRHYLVTVLENEGGQAVAPILNSNYNADYKVLSSNWSERHAAYVAGLGSFGLHRGLITAKGVAGRFGSVITSLPFKATPRSKGSHFQNCPFLVDGSCGACINRCPVGAITTEGKDKSKCHHYMFIYDNVKEMREAFGYKHSVCGKCQINVPCEDLIP
jgi:epoxyqueuosine reductase